MMAVINKHADMEDTERAHRQHKTQYDSSERPPQREIARSTGVKTALLVTARSMTAPSRPRAETASVWQNHLNYPGSSALAITIKATLTQTHLKRNNSWSVR